MEIELKDLCIIVDGLLRAYDPITSEHQDRVADLCLRVAQELELSEEDTRILVAAARIHDIGKIYIPSRILNRPSKLTNQEWTAVLEHPRQGYVLLADVDELRPIRRMVLQHHERVDGKGYPVGLKGKDLSDCVLILSACDSADAIRTRFHYKAGRELSMEYLLEELKKNSGTQFDPDIVRALQKVLEAEASDS